MVVTMKLAGRVGRIVLIVLLLGIVVLGFLGVPSPPGVTARGMERIGWGNLMDALEHGLPGVRPPQGVIGWLGNELLTEEVSFARRRLLVRARPAEKGREVGTVPIEAGRILVSRRDASYVVYELGDELVRLDLASKRTTVVAQGAGLRAGGWDQDGRRLSLSSRDGGETVIRVLNPVAGGAQEVFRGLGEWRAGRISPDGKRMLLWHRGAEGQRLQVLDLASRQAVPVGKSAAAPTGRSEQGQGFEQGPAIWHPTVDMVLYTSSEGTEFVTPRYLDLRTKAEVPVYATFNRDVVEIVPSPDPQWAALLVNENGLRKMRLLRMAVDLTQPADRRTIYENPPSDLSSPAFHPSEARLAWSQTILRGQPVAVTYRLENEETTLWDNPQLPRTYAGLQEPEWITFRTFDRVGEGAASEARRLGMWVMKPGKRFEGQRPVVIDLGEGPGGEAAALTDPELLLLNWKGATVIRPNLRGSAGAGKTFAALDDGKKREDVLRDLSALLDFLTDRPDFDATRIALTGRGYGGTLALAAAARMGNRIRCGIARSPVVDLPRWVQAQGEIGRREFGAMADTRGMLEGLSPLNFAGSMKTPFLVLADRASGVPYADSRTLGALLKSGGKTSAWVDAESFVQPVTRVYRWAAELAFFERHLFAKGR
jgi:dipeptidyl aminopeptidase/acylaminoacyl peptidase